MSNFYFKFSAKVSQNAQYLYETRPARFIVRKQLETWSGVVMTSF